MDCVTTQEISQAEKLAPNLKDMAAQERRRLQNRLAQKTCSKTIQRSLACQRILTMHRTEEEASSKRPSDTTRTPPITSEPQRNLPWRCSHDWSAVSRTRGSKKLKFASYPYWHAKPRRSILHAAGAYLESFQLVNEFD